jgi:hypothetical protein
VKIPLILRKIFESMAAESGRLPLKVGEFTCMEIPKMYYDILILGDDNIS